MSRALAIAEASDYIEAFDRAIQESAADYTDWGWNTIAGRGDAATTYTGGQRGARYWRGTPSIYDRDEGRYFPYYTEEQDLDEMRNKARFLGTFTAIATGAMQALSVYTMGGEWEYKFAGKKDAPQQPSKELLAELNAVLLATLDRNQWIGDFDCELHDESREAGDTVVSGYKSPDGICDFRRLDADQLKRPANETKLNNWLDVSPKNSWTFGVHTIWDERMRRIDHERAIGFHICFDDGGREWDYLPAWPQQHGDETLCDKFGHLIKRNTPRKAKRGLTDYWPVQTDMERDAKLSTNLAVGAAVLAGIPWFENHKKGTNRDQAQAGMAAGLSNYSRAVAANRLATLGDGRTVQHREPGTVVKSSDGIERTMGPLGQVRQPIYIEVCQHLRRSIGLRWLMPEYMISGDASNANFSSTLVSESPFVKAREADQRFYIAHFKAMLWKAIKVAFDHGRFAKFANLNFAGIVALCDLQIQPPMVASRDKTAQLAELDQLWQAGLLKGNEYRIDLKREPKPEYEEKTYSPQMLPGQLEQGLANVGRGEQPPPRAAGEPAKPDKPEGGGEPTPQPKPAGDRQGQLRAEAFSRAVENARTIEEARAIAGRFRSVTLENCGTGAGGFQAGNDCQCDGEGCAGGGEADDAKGGKQTESPEFKKWFGDSKVVDADGKPLRVFHGTSDDFDSFNLDHKNRKDTGWLGTGVYLTTSPEIAASYANLKPGYAEKNVMPLYAKVENPYYASIKDKQRLQIISNKSLSEGRAAADAWTSELKAKGHDGVILRFKESEVNKTNASDEIVVFSPSAVKSATGNRGTFDPDSDKITEGRWITLNGGSGKDGDGGTRVYVDDDGEVAAGPKGLKGKDLDDAGSGKNPPAKPATPKQAAKPKTASAPTSTVPKSADPQAIASKYEGWADSLDGSERKALGMMGTAAYAQVVGSLRYNEETPATKKIVAAFDSAIDKAPPLESETTVFRGDTRKIKATVGKTIVDRSFMSTSLDANVANDYAAGMGKGGTVYTIKLPKGSKAAYVDKWAGHKEMLLPRGSKLKVTRVVDRDGVRQIEAELVQ